MRNGHAPHLMGNSGGQGVRDSSLRLAEIIPHLHKVQRLSDGSYLACCPAHDDEHPSLSLKEENGRLLWHCFAGCSQDAVQRALHGLLTRTASHPEPQGLTLERYANAKQLPIDHLRAWGCENAQYQQIPAVRIPYRDTDGTLTAVRYRIALAGENRFRWRAGDKPALYGLWRLPEWQDAEAVYLCEGESDTQTLWTAGLPALGVPGASVWQEEWWGFLAGFERVYVIPDRDEAGRKLLMNLSITCPEDLLARVSVVNLPEGCKDVNALWIRERADRERFLQALNGFVYSSTTLREETNRRIDESSEAPQDDALPTFAPLAEILARAENREVEYLPLLGQDGLIARGTITLLAAHPKAGKTTLLIHACREWLQQGLKVLYLTEEPLAVWQLRLQQHPELANLYLNEIPRAHPIRWAQSIRQHAPDVVVVDTVRRFCQIRDENDSASVASALAPLVDLLNDLPRTALVLAHHTRKNLSPDGEITDVAGSHAFTAEVDTILILTPCKDHPRQRILTPIASRLWTLSPEPLVLELSENGSTYNMKGLASEVLPEQREQDAKAKVLEAMKALGEATVDEVREYLADTGCALARPTVYKALQELCAEGVLSREGTGSKGNPYRFRLFVYSSTPIGDRQIDESTDAESPDTPPIAEDSGLEAVYTRARAMYRPSDDVEALIVQLQRHPDFPLEEHEAERLRALYALAESLGFPALALPAWKFEVAPNRADWVGALALLGGTDALDEAMQALLQRDSSGSPALTANQSPSADRGCTPVQYTLM